MKNPIKLFLIFLLLFISGTANAQDKFIELTVSDTAILQPLKIIYQVKFGKMNGWMDDEWDDEDAADISGPSIMDIESLLEDKDFIFTSTFGDSYKISSVERKQYILVELSNETELKRLFNLLNGIEGITGNIYEITFEPVSNFYKLVYTELHNKALTQATLMATTAGSKIGQLISVTDVPDETGNYLEMMQDFMKEEPFSFLQNNTDVTKTVVFQMRFKFAIE